MLPIRLAYTDMMHRQSSSSPSPALKNLRKHEARYLASLAGRCAEVEPGVPLTDVYVMLEAVSRPQPQRPESPSELPDIPERLEQAGIPVEERSSPEQQAAPGRGNYSPAPGGAKERPSPEQQAAPPPPPVPIGKALQEATHLVVLGEPGAGKSTTLQFIALCFARRQAGWAKQRLELDESRIPLWVSLKELVAVLHKQTKAPQLERALAWILNDRDLRLADEEEAVQCLFAWRDAGRLLLLLDGLDELS
ncbi:MAG: NACHT domain-containing protein, partial [Calditrichaeota bacterium]